MSSLAEKVYPDSNYGGRKRTLTELSGVTLREKENSCEGSESF